MPVVPPDSLTPERIRQTTADVLARPEYDLEPADGWVFQSWWVEILKTILKPFLWLFEAMEGLPDVVRWMVVIGLFILLMALIAHIAWTFYSAFRDPHAVRRRRTGPREVPLEPVDLERAAERAGRDGRLVEAIRLLFRACILRIERAEQRQFRPGFTNREVLRRFHDTALYPPLHWFVATIDAKWYGDEPCIESDYDAGRERHERLCGLIGK